jgi:hypothetical protein
VVVSGLDICLMYVVLLSLITVDSGSAERGLRVREIRGKENAQVSTAYIHLRLDSRFICTGDDSINREN